MKIDRRSFLSFGIGAAAGIALSPLPWKLQDDVSIWTQNWPWTPVPKDGEVSYQNSVCSLCPGGCGIAVRKVGDRAVKIEGTKGHPINDGGICTLGLAGLQLLYGPYRVKSPLKRVGERGQGKWRKITWDEAIAEITKQLTDLRSEGKPQAVACISNTDRGTRAELLKRFLNAYGSPNFIHDVGSMDSYGLAMKLMQGASGVPCYDIENTDFLLSFGSGILDGWGAPVRMFRANSQLKDAKRTVVQIEPRLSNTAAKADRWIAIKPGTESVLALGLAHVIIREALYDKAFIDKHCFGFYGYKDDEGKQSMGFRQYVIENFTPENVEKITGVKASVIDDLAKKFAESANPVALFGRGQGDTPGSVHDAMAVHALNALVGSLNRKGGVWDVPGQDYVKWEAPVLDEIAGKGVETERVDGAGTERYRFAASLMNRLPDVLNAKDGAAIEALFVAGADPCYTLAGSANVKKAFEKIPFIVSFSSYMDDTAQMADLLLPDHVYLERYQDIPNPPGMPGQYIGLAKPVVMPQCDTKNTGDVIIRLAKALEGTVAEAFPWDNYEACLEATFGDKWKTLSEKGFIFDEIKPKGIEEAIGTASKKFEFFSKAYKHDASKDILSQSKIQGDEKAFPLVLIPFDSLRIANGSIGTPPFLMKTVPNTILLGQDCLVEVNPKTAKSIGLKEESFADLTTPVGKVRVRVHLFEGIVPGVIAMPRGLGHTGDYKYLAGKGVNFNTVISPIEDPVSGLDASWGIRAKLTKA